MPETVTSLGKFALNECLAMKELYLQGKYLLLRAAYSEKTGFWKESGLQMA